MYRAAGRKYASGGFLIYRQPTVLHPHKSGRRTRIFCAFLFRNSIFGTKNKVFPKKEAKTFGRSKKTAYLCIAIKGKAPWLN
ncbi:MAG TPA: hypothetical protein H9986_02240, partial [Candidatus Prevotella stercoripullorum]|nr:hypothetical protein [Candidatus Prevotella stercoripullorum]